MTSSLVVVCGLEAEARIARGDGAEKGVEVVAGGGDPTRILARLDVLKPAAVMSFGVAGGLAPGLAPGDACVADAVIGPDGARREADRAWAASLASKLGRPLAAFAGVDVPVGDPAAKARLREATGAVLVDMESHVVAAWAVRNEARFAAVRVVTDPAERALPHAALVGMKQDGGVDLPAVLGSLVRNPTQLPALIRTGLDARAAFASLLRCRQRLGPRFALVDLG